MRLQPQYLRTSGVRPRHVVIGAAITAALVAAGLTSGSAQALAQAAPHNSKEPTISGNEAVGSTLTGTDGAWTGTAPINFAYQWVRCPTSGGKPDGSDCAAISGATTSSYVLGSADAGKRLRIRVTASNSDGSVTVASNATGTIAAAPGGRPRNTTAPSISGSLSPGATLHADVGTWTGNQPITFTFQWLRCDTRGNNCLGQGGQGDSYLLRDGDSGHTVRVRVTATNKDGRRSALSSQTGVVSGGSGGGGGGLPPGAIKLANGEISIPATSVPSTERLVVADVSFTPNPVRSQSSPIAINVKVKDTRGYDVRGVLVFVRSTPLVTSTPNEAQTADDGTVTYTVQPNASFPIRDGYSVQFFVKAHRQGDNPLAGIAGYRLVQVLTAR